MFANIEIKEEEEMNYLLSRFEHLASNDSFIGSDKSDISFKIIKKGLDFSKINNLTFIASN